MIIVSYFIGMSIYSYDHSPRHQYHEHKVLSEHLGRQLLDELDKLEDTTDWVGDNTRYYGTISSIGGLYKKTVEKL